MLQNKLHVYCYLFFRTLREISYLKEKKLMHGKKKLFPRACRARLSKCSVPIFKVK